MLGRLLLDPNAESGGGSVDSTPTISFQAAVPTSQEVGFTPEEEASLSANRQDSATETQAQPTQPVQPADPNLTANATQQQATAQQWQSIRDAARTFGYDLSNHQDDASALAHLIQEAQRARQANVYARLGEQLAPQANQIREYLQQRQQPQQQAPPAWQPPEFDERWMSLVQRDEGTGVFYAKPGVDPAIAQKVNAYAEWQSKFQRNPAEVIEPMVATRAQEIAQNLVREQFETYRREQEARQILQQHASWIYQQDQQGRPIANPNTGQPQLSPLGARYASIVSELTQVGITDPRVQDTYAYRILQGEVAMQLARQQQTGNAAVNNPQAQQAVARPNRNPSQTIEPSRTGIVPGATTPSQEGLSLSERLRLAMDQEGLRDEDFASIGT
jgi:hypothetical protein